MTRPALLCLLLLASCSGGGSASRTEDDPQRQSCERAAANDPAVEQELRKQAGNLDYQWQYGEQIRAVRQQAVLRCLRARGLAPMGGVEAPRR